MIHQVSIKSLPQEWLWCETWCSEESKANTKTIDLVSRVIQLKVKDRKTGVVPLLKIVFETHL